MLEGEFNKLMADKCRTKLRQTRKLITRAFYFLVSDGDAFNSGGYNGSGSAKEEKSKKKKKLPMERWGKAGRLFLKGVMGSPYLLENLFIDAGDEEEEDSMSKL